MTSFLILFFNFSEALSRRIRDRNTVVSGLPYVRITVVLLYWKKTINPYPTCTHHATIGGWAPQKDTLLAKLDW